MNMKSYLEQYSHTALAKMCIRDSGCIGVHDDYQGKRLGSVLLQKAMDMAWHHDIHKLIGDIDVHNIAIRKNLIQCGFMLDCRTVSYTHLAASMNSWRLPVSY